MFKKYIYIGAMALLLGGNFVLSLTAINAELVSKDTAKELTQLKNEFKDFKKYSKGRYEAFSLKQKTENLFLEKISNQILENIRFSDIKEGE